MNNLDPLIKSLRDQPVSAICGYCGWPKSGPAGEQCQPEFVDGRWHQ